eukprot:UN04092
MVLPFLETENDPETKPLLEENNIRKPIGPCRKNLPVILTTIIVLVAMTISLFVTNLGFMNVINGTLSLLTFDGLAPGMLGIFILSSSQKTEYNILHTDYYMFNRDNIQLP